MILWFTLLKRCSVFQFVAGRQSHVYSSQLFLNVFLILSPLSLKWTTAPLPYIPCVHIIVSEVVLLCSVLYVLWSPSLLPVVYWIHDSRLPLSDLYHVAQPSLYEMPDFRQQKHVKSFPSLPWPGKSRLSYIHYSHVHPKLAFNQVLALRSQRTID